MAVITNENISGTWSATVTLSGPEYWQVRGGPVFIATQAASAPASDADGLLLDAGDIISLENGEEVRYRSTSDAAFIVRRARL